MSFKKLLRQMISSEVQSKIRKVVTCWSTKVTSLFLVLGAQLSIEERFTNVFRRCVIVFVCIVL